MIIGDYARISRAERKLRRAHGAQVGFSSAELLKTIRDATEQVRAKMEALKHSGENISIVEVFEMQLLMNHLGQLSEMSASSLGTSGAPIGIRAGHRAAA